MARIPFFPIDQMHPHVGTDLCVHGPLAMEEACELEEFGERTIVARFMVSCDLGRPQDK